MCNLNITNRLIQACLTNLLLHSAAHSVRLLRCSKARKAITRLTTAAIKPVMTLTCAPTLLNQLRPEYHRITLTLAANLFLLHSARESAAKWALLHSDFSNNSKLRKAIIRQTTAEISRDMTLICVPTRCSLRKANSLRRHSLRESAASFQLPLALQA